MRIQSFNDVFTSYLSDVVFADHWMMPRVDYFATVLISSPKIVTDELQWVLNAAARIITDRRKFDRGLMRAMRHELHWLDCAERVKIRTASLMYCYLNGRAHTYLLNCASHWFVSKEQSRASSQLTVPFAWLTGLGNRAFSVAGPGLWNSTGLS